MPAVEIHRLDEEKEATSQFGEHIWMTVAFSSGLAINIRIDEYENSKESKFDSVITLKKGRNGFVKEEEIKI